MFSAFISNKCIWLSVCSKRLLNQFLQVFNIFVGGLYVSVGLTAFIYFLAISSSVVSV